MNQTLRLFKDFKKMASNKEAEHAKYLLNSFGSLHALEYMHRIVKGKEMIE